MIAIVLRTNPMIRRRIDGERCWDAALAALFVRLYQRTVETHLPEGRAVHTGVQRTNVVVPRFVQRLCASKDAGIFVSALTALNKFFVSVQTLDIGRPILEGQAFREAFPQERETFAETNKLIRWTYEVRRKVTDDALSNWWRRKVCHYRA